MRIAVRRLGEHQGYRAVIGSFEPITKYQLRLFKTLSSKARRDGLGSAVVILDPAPASFLEREWGWPILHDLPSRIHIITALRIDLICVCAMSPDEANSGAKRFISLLKRKFPLRSLWLGAGQSLGPGPQGSAEAIDRACVSLGVSLERMSVIQPKNVSGISRMLFAQGRVAEAVSRLGHAATISRAASEQGTDWPQGTFGAMPGLALAQSEATSPDQLTPVVFVREGKKTRPQEWPFPNEDFMSIFTGPADD